MPRPGRRTKKRRRAEPSDPGGWRGSPAWPHFRHSGVTRQGRRERLRWLWRRLPGPAVVAVRLVALSVIAATVIGVCAGLLAGR
ncbi:MAG TPA: hypothetical protein VEG38_20080 [Acidimicrobiia bacterium]|nr:hypothetical protein [Acidimicrobiia bacterium]